MGWGAPTTLQPAAASDPAMNRRDGWVACPLSSCAGFVSVFSRDTYHSGVSSLVCWGYLLFISLLLFSFSLPSLSNPIPRASHVWHSGCCIATFDRQTLSPKQLTLIFFISCRGTPPVRIISFVAVGGLGMTCMPRLRFEEHTTTFF